MLDFKRWFSFSLPAGRAVTQQSLAMIEPYAEQRKAGAVVLGMASDLSLNYYDSLIGTKEGPDSIRRMLAKLPDLGAMPLYDAGVIEEEVTTEGRATGSAGFEAMRTRQYERLCGMLRAGHFPIVLGGGHEVAIGSFQALSDTLHQASDGIEDGMAQLPNAGQTRIGIINIDANFQLRRSLAVRAGSAFHSVASFCQEHHREFHYLGLGMCDHTNSQATFAYARELGVDWLLDREMKMKNRKRIQATIEAYLARVDHVHLSLDLSVFPSLVAEGVNLSRIYGVNLPVVEMVIRQIMESGKVRIMDVTGLNTEFDYQGDTARLAAKLIRHALKSVSP
ncbi:arginase family protein [Photobacterium ganghwense]|uniref:arginase family protein n=1 Tax=Photobacterium ganghwense TaxID=320778 RepID=UPI0039EF88F7